MCMYWSQSIYTSKLRRDIKLHINYGLESSRQVYIAEPNDSMILQHFFVKRRFAASTLQQIFVLEDQLVSNEELKCICNRLKPYVDWLFAVEFTESNLPAWIRKVHGGRVDVGIKRYHDLD